MDPPVITDALTEADIDAVRLLFREYAREVNECACFREFERELAELPGRYAPPAGRLLLARINGAAAGCVALRPLGDGACEMKRLYVRAPHRAARLGRALADRVVREARAAGHRVMRLDTLPRMQAAIGMYRRMGFSERGPYYENPLPDVIFMELDLARDNEALPSHAGQGAPPRA